MFTDAEWFTAELKLVVSSMFQVQIHHQHRKRHFMLTQALQTMNWMKIPHLSWHFEIVVIGWSEKKESSFDGDGKTSRDTAKSNIWRGKPRGCKFIVWTRPPRSLSKTITSLSSLSPEMFYFGFTNITAASSRPRGCSSYCVTPARVMEVWQRGKYKGRRKDWRPGQPVKGAEV